MRITLGSDPEFFVMQDGKFRSAHGLVEGTKENPQKIPGGMVQVDGMALEIGIDAVDNADDWVANHKQVMKGIRDIVPKDYEFAIVPSCKFNGNHFRAQPEEARELGCNPDFNAYTLKANPRPDNKTTMRTASGHIHIGFMDDNVADPTSDEHMIRCATLVKQLDCYLGLPSLIFDKDKKRRSMYGAAGAFRPKEYGVEYRVLSNAWLLNENRMRFVFNQTVRAVNDLVKGVRVADKIGGAKLTRIIDLSDTYSAENLIINHLPDGLNIVHRARGL